MARVLVLGGTSYVAQFVLQRLIQDTTLCVAGDNVDKTEEVAAVACTIRRGPFPLPRGFVDAESGLAETSPRVVRVYWAVDVLDQEALQKCVEQFHPTVVVNCTALSSAGLCQKNPEKARSVNEPRGLVTLLAKMSWRIRFVHFSTDFVYDGLKLAGESYEENEAKLSPLLSEYGATKLRFDQYLLEDKHSVNLEVLILRIANVVGPSAPLLPDHSAPKFMQWLHLQLFNSTDLQQTPLTLWRDEFRSYLYVLDVVTVMFKLLAIEFKASASLFNVGGEKALSRVELARRYLAACAKHDRNAAAAVTREFVPTARMEVDLGYPSPLNTQLDTTRLAQQLPGFAWTPTDEILDAISHAFLLEKPN